MNDRTPPPISFREFQRQQAAEAEAARTELMRRLMNIRDRPAHSTGLGELLRSKLKTSF